MAEIILKENIRNVGKIGQIINVANGYAFNFLIPQNKAMPATKENIEILEKQKAQILLEDTKKKEHAKTLSQKIPSYVYITRDVNENGLLYGAITAKDIIEQVQVITDKHNVHFNNHIQKYGVYPIELELHHDVIVKITLSVSDTIENAKKQIDGKKSKKISNDSESLPEQSQN